MEEYSDRINVETQEGKNKEPPVWGCCEVYGERRGECVLLRGNDGR